MLVVNIIEEHLARFLFAPSIPLYKMRRMLFSGNNQSKPARKMPNGTIYITDENGMEKTLHCAKYHYCLNKEQKAHSTHKNKITSTVYQPVKIDACFAFQKRIFGKPIWNKRISAAENCLACHQQCLCKAELGEISIIPNTMFL